MTAPTPSGFLEFIRNQMGVPTAALPDNSIYITWSYDEAIETVNRNIQRAAPIMYLRAVYNLAASLLINSAQDVVQDPPLPTGTLGYFATIRQALGLNSLLAGLVSSASDEGSSGSLATPDFIKNLSLSELALIKDPYGRAYLSIAQKYGTVWGLN